MDAVDLDSLEKWLDAHMKADPQKTKDSFLQAIEAAGMTRINGTCVACGQMTGVCLRADDKFEDFPCHCGGKLEKCS